MTPFALLLRLCGLDHAGAAAWLGVSADAVRSWASGRRRTPADTLERLAALDLRLARAAREAAARIRAAPPGTTIELGLAASDAEAQSLGWPSAGVHAQCLARAAADAIRHGRRVAIVRRGSTPATAAASAARKGVNRARTMSGTRTDGQ
jgi:hypothetical protein